MVGWDVLYEKRIKKKMEKKDTPSHPSKLSINIEDKKQRLAKKMQKINKMKTSIWGLKKTQKPDKPLPRYIKKRDSNSQVPGMRIQIVREVSKFEQDSAPLVEINKFAQSCVLLNRENRTRNHPRKSRALLSKGHKRWFVLETAKTLPWLGNTDSGSQVLM